MKIVEHAIRALAKPGGGDLVARMRSGDQKAFTELYRNHHGPVFRFALHMSGSEHVAEEVTQDVFMLLIVDAHSFDPARGTLASFLFGVARNMVRRHIGGDHTVPIPDADEDQTPASLISNHDALGDLTRREAVESVRQAILSLPPNFREAVVFCDLQEMSYEEAAVAIGCAVGTVRSRLHRARAMLAGKLQRCMV